MPRYRLIALATAVLLSAPAARARDSLTIGIAEFPSSLHPSIDPLLIKNRALTRALSRLSPAAGSTQPRP